MNNLIRKIIFFHKLKSDYKISHKMKFFLWLDYFKNIKFIKNRNRLKLSHFFIDNFKVDQRIKNEILNEIDNLKKEKRKLIKIEKIIQINIKPLNLKDELQDIYGKEFQAKLNKFKMFWHKIYRIFNLKYLLDRKNSQDNIKRFFHFLSENIKIYKKSLEELVEGHREVTYNKDFKFQDGQTVQNKIDKVV